MISTRTQLKGLIALVLAMSILLSVATDTDARRRSRRQRENRTTVIRLQRVAPEVATLPFGQGLDQVVNWARVRLEGRFAPRLKSALDMHERAAIQMQFDRAVQRVRNSLVAADGTRTGYEVSVVAGEFAAGVGESVLLFRVGGNEHYFFFTEGVLWKYARPLSGNISYDRRLERYKGDHGDPDAQANDKRGRESRWRGQDVELRLAERRRVFRSDLVVVTSRSMIEMVARRRGSAKKPAPRSENPELREYIANPGDE